MTKIIQRCVGQSRLNHKVCDKLLRHLLGIMHVAVSAQGDSYYVKVIVRRVPGHRYDEKLIDDRDQRYIHPGK